MTRDEILEGNKLIAEFVGLKPNPHDNGKTWGSNVWTHENGDVFADWWKELQYHSSWDWLMPVVEKIESLESVLLFSINHKTVKVYASSKYTDFDISYNGVSKINAVFTTVVEFIKWYNQNNQS